MIKYFYIKDYCKKNGIIVISFFMYSFCLFGYNWIFLFIILLRDGIFEEISSWLLNNDGLVFGIWFILIWVFFWKFVVVML